MLKNILNIQRRLMQEAAKEFLIVGMGNPLLDISS